MDAALQDRGQDRQQLADRRPGRQAGGAPGRGPADRAGDRHHDGSPLALGRAPRPHRGHRRLQRRPRPDVPGPRLLITPHAHDPSTRRLSHDHDRRSRTGTLRAADDQRGALQRRGAARGARRRHHADRAPLRAQQLRAARARRHARDRRRRRAARPPSRSTTCARCRRSSGPSPSNAPATAASTMRPLPTGEPWGDYAVSTARWTGALLTTCSRRPAGATDGVDVRFEGADHGPYHLHPILAETDEDDLTFVRALPLALAADPAAEILIAYEMNGEPLRPDHGAPFRLIVPHWYAVASVKWLHRIDVLTEPTSASSRPATTSTSGPTAPTSPSPSCACGPGSPTPRPAPCSPPARTRSAARPGPAPDRSPASRSASPAKATGTRPSSSRPPGPYHWQDWTFDWDAHRRRPAHPAGPSDRRRRQRPTRGPAVEPARLRQQRHRSHLRRRAVMARAVTRTAAVVERRGRPSCSWSSTIASSRAAC